MTEPAARAVSAVASGLDRLEAEIAELAAHLHAGMGRFLRLLGEFDRRDGWAGSGFRSFAHWVSWRCGVSPEAAREHVRVARALRGLPLLASAIERGTLSYSKVRALTRIATPDSEEMLLEWAEHATAAQLERVVRGVRLARSLADPRVRHKRRSLRWDYDEDGSLVIRARLVPEEGAVVLRALEAALADLDRDRGPAGAAGPAADVSAADVSAGTLDDDDPDAAPPWERRNADALCRMAERSLAGPAAEKPGADRALIVVHVDRDRLRSRSGERCELAGGPPLTPETVRRLACDASVIEIAHGGPGAPASIGRRSRVVPHRMRRALRSRDGGCRFPACPARRVDAHHIRHWAHGGETSLRNLVLLCRRHHRLVHEEGFGIERRGADDGLVFLRPDGREIVARASPVLPGGEGLVRAHRLRRLAIGPQTCASRWDGRHPDYGLAVEAVLTAGHLRE